MTCTLFSAECEITLRCLPVLIVRVHEAQQLRAELTVARMAERAAREKYQDFMRTSSMYGVSECSCLFMSDTCR